MCTTLCSPCDFPLPQYTEAKLMQNSCTAKRSEATADDDGGGVGITRGVSKAASVAPRGHGLCGAWLSWAPSRASKARPVIGRCEAYDAIGETYELVDEHKRRHTMRLHGSGSTCFELLAPAPTFKLGDVAAARGACGLCHEAAAAVLRRTFCCDQALCAACVARIAVRRAEHNRSVAHIAPASGRACPFCNATGERRDDGPSALTVRVRGTARVGIGRAHQADVPAWPYGESRKAPRLEAATERADERAHDERVAADAEGDGDGIWGKGGGDDGDGDGDDGDDGDSDGGGDTTLVTFRGAELVTRVMASATRAMEVVDSMSVPERIASMYCEGREGHPIDAADVARDLARMQRAMVQVQLQSHAVAQVDARLRRIHAILAVAFPEARAM